MRTEVILLKTSRPANAAIATGRVAGKIVNEKIVVCGANDDSDGVIDEPCDAANDEVTLIIDASPINIVTGAAYAVDAKLTTDAAGKYVAAGAGQKVAAIAEEASTGANQKKAVRLVRRGTVA